MRERDQPDAVFRVLNSPVTLSSKARHELFSDNFKEGK
jgi:hypothetical protein